MRVLWETSGASAWLEGEAGGVARLCDCTAEIAIGGRESIEAVRACLYDAVIGEFPMTGWEPEEWLQEVRRADRSAPVIILHHQPTLDEAIRLTKLGAEHYLPADSPAEEIAHVLGEALEHRSAAQPAGLRPLAEPWKRFLVGESRAMKEIEQIIRLVAPRRCTVLITGETGTGKEMVARATHAASSRGYLPMVAVACGALPEALFEAELFGHVKGAFTGAISSRIGRFEQADHSTLFFDEIGAMPLVIQAKLLRAIQEREFQRLGGVETVHVDVRIIAASNLDLAEQVRQGTFREDLYYRLNVVPIHLSPLRDRVCEIPLLVQYFLAKICGQEGIPLKRIAPAVLERLCAYGWPGNVRQLENSIEMAIALSGDISNLVSSDFPLPLPVLRKPGEEGVPLIWLPDEGLDFERTLSGIELSVLNQALERAGGNKKQAARLLHLKRTTFSAKLKSLESAGDRD